GALVPDGKRSPDLALYITASLDFDTPQPRFSPATSVEKHGLMLGPTPTARDSRAAAFHRSVRKSAGIRPGDRPLCAEARAAGGFPELEAQRRAAKLQRVAEAGFEKAHVVHRNIALEIREESEPGRRT